MNITVQQCNQKYNYLSKQGITKTQSRDKEILCRNMQQTILNKKKKTLKMWKDVGMACQKVYKQGIGMI